MDPLSNVFSTPALSLTIQWLSAEDVLWPYAGIFIGVCFTLAWMLRDNKVAHFFIGTGLLATLFEGGLYFGLPTISTRLVGKPTYLPESHLWVSVAGVFSVVVAFVLAYRYFSPALETISHFFTKTSRLERNRKTDIRQISVHLPNAKKQYDPCQYFNQSKGIFFGINEQNRPVYLPWEKWQKSHVDIIGTTGCGKGIQAGVLLSQSVSYGSTVVAVDPKSDEYLPHVMYQAANEAKVPYIFLDLLSDKPQWNPLQGKSNREIEELLVAGFSLGEKGTDADFYRLDDRRAARVFASILPTARPSLSEAYQMFVTQEMNTAETGKKFKFDLEELSMIPATRIDHGIDLKELINSGAVIYVRGSMRNPSILKLQRIFVLSVMQIIEARDRESARQVCLFLDEVKYQLTSPTLEAIAGIRDKRAHVVIAHQSLGDLRDCPADLDPESVVSSINENCSIKVAYGVKDPDTADWLARMSGQILVDDEVRQVNTNVGLSETRENGRSLRQAERALIDTNMLHALPDRCAVLYGDGLAKFFFTSPIKVTKTAEAVTPTQFETNVPKSFYEGKNLAHQSHAPTIGRALLDVD